MTKRPNPYTTLANDAREWARSVLMARARTMWRYPKERLNEGHMQLRVPSRSKNRAP